MQDAGEAAQRMAHSLLVPQPLGTFTEKPDTTALATLDIPTAYVLSTEDLSLPGEWAWGERFPQRLKNPLIVQARAATRAASRPAELADAFVRACAA